MNKAFDAVLQTEVDAAVIAKTSYSGYNGRFRYKCLCCGEEVYLAATDSNERAPHCRHRRGNNDTECERYLGRPGALEYYVSVRKHNQEKVEFYFNQDKMTFEICVSFTEEELMERFVRGDKSRNTEGSGLGLSIAKSLTELQNGEFNIVIDGDLFKVEIAF